MTSAEPVQPGMPLVSVVMANFEAGGKIVHALRSVLNQTLADIEVIVSDDCSRDDSLEHVERLMAADPRIRLVTAERNGGPARCRNRALDMARGRWIAIVDCDDIVHPERFERLLAAAAHYDADIVADDLLLFHEDGTAPRLMLGEEVNSSFEVSAESWVLAGINGTPALGYLKPLVKAESLKSLRYDENLRIGEDYDLVLRLLLAGAGMVVVPEPFYLYRRHGASISHRLSSADVTAMIERQQALCIAAAPLPPALASAFERRLRVLRQGLAYERLVASIKARRLGEALALLAGDPTHAGRLWASFTEGRRRRVPAVALPPSPVLFLGGAGRGAVADPVPPYIPVHATDWSAPRPRRFWRALAARRGDGPVQCVPLDEAGRYAAGFIPEAEIAYLDVARESS